MTTDAKYRELEQDAIDARHTVLEAEIEYQNAIRDAFPVGRRITYSHGKHRVSCEVVDHGYGDTLLVRGTYSGKTYPISAYRALHK